MERQLVIEKYPWETRIGIIEDGRLVEVFLEQDEDRVGNIYKGRVKNVLPGLSCAFLDLGFGKNAFLYLGDLWKGSSGTKIGDLLKKDQEVLVQVKKEEMSSKGARVTTLVTIPGHYLVLLPFQNEVSISRKVNDPEIREELRSYLKDIKPDGVGLIVRTAGAAASLHHLREELEKLLSIWRVIEKKKNSLSAPALIYREPDLVHRTLREYLDSNTRSIVVNSNEEAESIKEKANKNLATDGIEIAVESNPFESRGLEREIKRLSRSRVWLKNGGYLVIEETEAMTVIDINSGKYIDKQELEETILKTNLDAAYEIPRQLRLRGIGGMIIMDFIDMKHKNHYDEVINVLNSELQNDKSRCRVYGITRLGLVEMTRKKSRSSLGVLLCNPCPACEGKGRLTNPRYIVHEILRKLHSLGHRQNDLIQVQVLPEVMPYLKEEKENLDFIQEQLKKTITLSVNPELTEYYAILP